MNLNSIAEFLRNSRIPIVEDLRSASWPNWREGIRELFVTLFFSLMPLWLGLLIVKLLALPDDVPGFIAKFASSSSLGILSTSLLGPMLYMMYREDSNGSGNRAIPSFPSGLWFIMATVACCIVATVIYSFTYVSGIQEYFKKDGSPLVFVQSETVTLTSWALFVAVVVLLLFASTIRNSMETQAPRIMSAETESYVKEMQAAQGDQGFIEQMQAAQGGEQ